jgi:hypothetical protein
MEKKEHRIGDFKIRVSYSPVECTYMHRYHIECIDMLHLVKVFEESNVIDITKEYDMEKAIAMISNYFKHRFSIDIFSIPKKGWL